MVTPVPGENPIRIRGARQNNLKGIDLDLPLGKLIVVTGLSGTGKSSLVFDTLHAEGNRRYVETFSPYTRQFLERMDRPEVDSIDNIRASIAIEQGNSVKTSRSTVGTMTELTDYFKVWFSHSAQLIDPGSGRAIIADSPETVWERARKRYQAQTVVVAFPVRRPGNMDWPSLLPSVVKQGYSRLFAGGKFQKIESADASALDDINQVWIVQDRLEMDPANAPRFMEAARTAFHFGDGQLQLLDPGGNLLEACSEDLRIPGSDKRHRPATPNLFSFNSALGACPDCRGFGRIIEIDDNRIIPHPGLSISEGVIKAFSGAVYSESQRDLLRACKRKRIPIHRPWKDLLPDQRNFVMEGDPDFSSFQSGKWYGVRRFFKWLEENTYKMHVRVFLSRYRAYVECPSCGGLRLTPEALAWQWNGYRLPDLYRLPVSDLLPLLQMRTSSTGNRQLATARATMLNRLSYLDEIGLGYLTLDRPSRTLSGGETQRVNLTSCLGTSLVDTLFIMDEPSIGLHCRDIERLVRALRRLTDAGNTVVVVEHDETVMRAADLVVELGPRPGAGGGRIHFSGTPEKIVHADDSPTGRFLSGREKPPGWPSRPVQEDHPACAFRGIHQHNLQGLDVDIPLQRLVVLSGVSGSGKSTLMESAVHQGLLARSGQATENCARIDSIECPMGFSEILLVDQSTVSRTPRSNPALFVGAWDAIRNLYASTPQARKSGFTAAAFSFNSGNGRCPTCEGNGYERIEMQFMADVYVPCPACEGKRFIPDILEIEWKGQSIHSILQMTVKEALAFFDDLPKIKRPLQPLIDVGLEYLPLGQPLNSLSGGESQRLKLVKFLANLHSNNDHALILLDEPTTGLHRADIQRLVVVLQRLVDTGHSLVVIEHHPDVIRAADWLLELGPEGGEGGGRLLYAGPPSGLSLRCPESPTARFLNDPGFPSVGTVVEEKAQSTYLERPQLRVTGAREHNLKNLNCEIPLNTFTVVTGVSGSGKSTLAFDIIFAEGQRRFMESMSSWARQFVEQMPKPDIDSLEGIQPTIAIEQRVTRGSSKSTVATITEVAQYLRLLYARMGVAHSPKTGQRLIASDSSTLVGRLHRRLKAIGKDGKKRRLLLLAPLVRGRKGHHEPIANWARSSGFSYLRCDGDYQPTEGFQKLDRYREHDVDLVVAELTVPMAMEPLRKAVKAAIDHGKGTFALADREDPLSIEWFSIHRTDPTTGEAFPELDPRHFSWNAAKGWCPVCRGQGRLLPWMREDERFADIPADWDLPSEGMTCPDCNGQRLNATSRSVYLFDQKLHRWNLPELLSLSPPRLLEVLRTLQMDTRDKAVFKELLPEIHERLRFMESVGLDYLSLDRATATLSGGEAQRIRLAAQLGSNLSGALYVLDEPSIGLHAADGDRLLDSLDELKAKGNTLLVVEHDPDTLRAADHIIDLGPGAGAHGGRLLAAGTLQDLLSHEESITGNCLRNPIVHPSRGERRPLPRPLHARRKSTPEEWIVLKNARLRNLKGFDLHLPKNRLIGVCGVSGAGKSTLIRDLLGPAIESAISRKAVRLRGDERHFKALQYADGFRKVIEVDQNPIGKTPRSTPATYINAFDRIREIFSRSPEARVHGYGPGVFSFNTKGGRCEVCKGAGRRKLEMNFLPDSYLECDACGGSRYERDLLAIQWNGKSIADVLQMSFEEAADFFSFDTQLHALLDLMVQTGLGYLNLGQASPTLSGGEAQRLKLVSELAKGLPTFKDRRFARKSENCYILEEPTIGLHLQDVRRLLDLLHRMVDQGHTVIVIEHHLDVLADVDYLVEIGPMGGDAGGQLLFSGPPEEIFNAPQSPTAPYLRDRIIQ